jgi:hypothetical protein
MNQHRNTKTIQQYKDTKQRLQKETRRAYWNYIHDVKNVLFIVFPLMVFIWVLVCHEAI